MSQVPKLCNDMMNLGRLQGYEVCPFRARSPFTEKDFSNLTFSNSPVHLQGKLTSQGKLLQQETFFVTEQDTGVLSRSKERRVFLFEQIVIFSELLRKGSSTPGYQFKKSIKVHPEYFHEYLTWKLCVPAMLELCPWQVSYLGLEESVDNDPCKFVLSCRGSSERFTLQAANVDIKQVWVRHIQMLLDDQSKFLYGEEMRSKLSRLSLDTPGVLILPLCAITALQSPIEYQKDKIGAGSSSSLTRNRSSSGNRPAMSNRPSSAVGLGEKGTERGRSQMRASTSNGGPSCFESRVRSWKTLFYSL